MLSGKYNKDVSDLSEIAKLLGSKGGKARAKKLTSEQRSSIASKGAQARKESLLLKKRIIANFEYLQAIQELQPQKKIIKRLKTCRHKLPGIYRYET